MSSFTGIMPDISSNTNLKIRKKFKKWNSKMFLSKLTTLFGYRIRKPLDHTSILWELDTVTIIIHVLGIMRDVSLSRILKIRKKIDKVQDLKMALVGHNHTFGYHIY